MRFPAVVNAMNEEYWDFEKQLGIRTSYWGQGSLLGAQEEVISLALTVLCARTHYSVCSLY